VLTLTSAQTEAMEKGRYLFDVELYNFDSDSTRSVERILQGQIQIDPAITRTPL
jgi:hypothetical protein